MCDSYCQNNCPSESTIIEIIERFQRSDSVEDQRSKMVIVAVHKTTLIWSAQVLMKNIKYFLVDVTNKLSLAYLVRN